MKRYLFVVFVIVNFNISAQQSDFIDSLMQSSTILNKEVLANPEKYKLQIIYTQINRDTKNTPHFITYTYHNNPKSYFYPASTVKLPAAVLALEKINRLHKKGISKYTNLSIDSSYVGQEKLITDSTAIDNKPSIAHFIKKILLVSDNEAFNRLYEFIGQKDFNKALWRKGFKDVMILRRLSFNYDHKQNRYTNAFNFYNDEGQLIYHQKPQYNSRQFMIKADSLKQGSGFYQNGDLVKEQKSFQYSNFESLSAQHDFLIRLMFPKSFSKHKQFRLTESDYRFLYQYMSMRPRESDIKVYHDYKTYFDGFVKFFLFGNTTDTIPKHIRVFNKVGEAYGYLIDNAYIVDFDKGIEFMLSAVIYVNKNQIFNDDVYEYDTVGFPFLANLGKVFYDFEKHRHKPYLPNLSAFKVVDSIK